MANSSRRDRGQSVELLAALRKLNLQTKEVQLSTGGPATQTRPSSDPQHQTAAATQSLNVASRVVVGRITDATPVGQVYRVQLEKMARPMVAMYMPRTPTTRFGAIEFTSLQPGTAVLCYLHEAVNYAVILGTLPPPNIDPDRALFGLLHTSTRARVDDADFAPYRMEGGGGAISFSAGRPYDAVLGDYGAISETGCRVLVDSFMAQIGVTEMSQLTCYHHDMLVKLAAYNYIAWTSGSERESLNDQDEVSDWTGYATYPWEQLGLFGRTDPTRLLTSQEWQKETPAYSKMEPIDDYMMPFHREREWHGYLGQGGRRSVVGPPQTEEARAKYLSYSGGNGLVSPVLPGLYDEFTLLDGRHGMQSAKGISIVKRAAIMLPVRKRRPEDPKGDNSSNYSASGNPELGAGTPLKITGDIAIGTEHTSQSRALGIMDMHAYFFNYANNQPFIGHGRDYSVAEESQAELTDGVSEDVPTFSELRTKMFIDATAYKKRMFVDARYGEQDIHTLPCGIEFLDDGGVVLFGGCGEEIRMAGGTITISAPGDVWVKPGRNANIWAGDDMNIRARNSVDIIATEHDVRLKSEKNMQLIAGNSHSGGLLLESRSYGSEFDATETGENAVTSGIVFRAPHSVVATWAQDIYLRTGSEDGAVGSGVIILDAAKGKQQVITIAANITNHVKNLVEFNFGEPGEPTQTAIFSPNMTTLTGVVFVNGHMGINGAVYARDSLFSATGHVYTARSEANNYYVGLLRDESLTDVLDFVAIGPERISVTLPEAAKARYARIVTDGIYMTNHVGNDDVITSTSGSLRVKADYGSGAFVVFEDRWQQLARLNSEFLSPWRENAVVTPKANTYPYPGEEAFTTASSVFYRQDVTMFNVAAGRSRSHGAGSNVDEKYSSPAFAVPEGGPLSNYTVLGSEG